MLVLAGWIGAWIPAARADFEVGRWQIGTNGSFAADPPAVRSPIRLTAGASIAATWRESLSWRSFLTNLAAPVPVPAWNVDRWSTQHGLPSNRVRTLCFGADGYLWIGTTEGLGRFDGHRLAAFNERNSEVLQRTSSDIRSLVLGPDGSLWIAARQGLSRLDRNRWEVMWVAPAGTKMVLRDLAFGADGTVWVGTHLGVRRLVGGRLESKGIPEPLASGEIVYLRMDREGRLWAGLATGGVLGWKPGEGHSAGLVSALPNTGLCTGLAVGSDGTVWTGRVDGLEARKGDQVARLYWPEKREPGAVYGLHPNRLACGPTGTVWVSMGLEGSLGRVGEGGPEPLMTAAGTTLDEVSAIAEDAEGNVWCGTRAGGLVRMRRQKVVPLALEDPVTASRVLSVTEGPGGSIWCGVRGGLVIFGRDSAALLRTPFSDRSLDIFSTLSVDSRSLWSTFQPSGMLHLDLQTPGDGTGGGQPIVSIQGLGWKDVRAFCQTRDGAMWAGSGTGLHRGPGHWVTLGTDHGLGAADVRAIHQSRDGTLWVGTFGGGLSRWRDADEGSSVEPAFETWRKRDGLSDDRVLGIHEDVTGALWVITHDGLTRWQSGQFFAFGARHGLPESLLNGILEDDFGRLWISGNSGIFQVSRSALEAVARGEENWAQCVLYNESDGMLVSETNGEQQPSACRASDGRLYFATQRGVAVIDPRQLLKAPPPPEPRIEEVMSAGVVVWSHPLSLQGGAVEATGADDRRAEPKTGVVPLKLRLPPSASHTLAIRYSASALAAPEGVRFEHWPVGLDKGWQPGNSDRIAYFGHLAPGRYELRMRAVNHHGIWSDATTPIHFELDPKFWQTWTFRGLVVLACVALSTAILGYRLRVQRGYLKLQHEHSLELERTRISRDMHDQLGASLSRLGLLAGSAGATQRQVREVLQELRELIWTVSPKYDSLSDVADFLGNTAQQYLDAAGIALDLQVPTTLPEVRISSHARHHVAASFKEALRNTVQHSGATEVVIALTVDDLTLGIRIQDNGRGFEVPATVPGSRGLTHIQERLAELGGTSLIESAAQTGAGTRVELRIPLSPLRTQR